MVNFVLITDNIYLSFMILWEVASEVKRKMAASEESELLFFDTFSHNTTGVCKIASLQPLQTVAI